MYEGYRSSKTVDELFTQTAAQNRWRKSTDWLFSPHTDTTVPGGNKSTTPRINANNLYAPDEQHKTVCFPQKSPNMYRKTRNGCLKCQNLDTKPNIRLVFVRLCPVMTAPAVMCAKTPSTLGVSVRTTTVMRHLRDKWIRILNIKI